MSDKEVTNGLGDVKLNLVDSVEKAQEFISWLSERRPYNAIAIDTETGELPGGKREDALSPWHEWLHKEYHEDLVNRVRRKNNLMGMAAINAKTQERLPKFISGESDLLS